MSWFLLIVGLFLFVGLVVVHEFGHFLAARRGGVDVEEFGIGFPPKIWAKKMKSNFLFTINLLPLGGFVRLKGENDSATAPGSFGAAPLKTKIKIMLAGVGMNLLSAFALLTLLAIIGMPKLIDGQYTVKSDTKVAQSQVLVGFIEKDSPASQAGLKVRDQLTKFTSGDKSETVTGSEMLPKITKEFGGQDVTISIIRDKQPMTLRTKLRSAQEIESSLKSSTPKGYLGVSPAEYTLRRSTWSAPIVALGVMKQFTFATFKGLGSTVVNLFHGRGHEASQQVSGPVGIFVILKDGSLLGINFVLMIIAVISLTLAIMNVLPIPALDGGRLFVTLIFRAARKRLTQSMEEKIHGTGFAILMALFVLITIVDIKRFF